MKQFNRPGILAAAVSAALASMASLPAMAFEFSLANDEVKGSLDTTVTYGALWRSSNRSPELIGLGNGGTARSVNGDDGNLNYDQNDLVSSLLKVNHDLGLKYRDVGLFTRVLYFYDFAVHNMPDCPSGAPLVGCTHGLVDKAKDRLADDVRLLDAYVYGSTDVLGRTLNARLGNQVLNWGESTFIRNGINSAMPVDVARFRAPGSEVKEGLLPVPMVWAALNINDTVSAEAFYQFDFVQTRIDPRGSFFSSNDLLSPGGDLGFLGTTGRPDQHVGVLGPTAGSAAAPFGGHIWITRDGDKVAKDSGQFGFAARLVVPEWNSTEFGAYFVNHHSNTPFLSGISSGNQTGVANLGSLITAELGSLANPSCATNQACGIARVMSDFPENIKVFGLSVNTAGPFDTAVQAEYSYRPKQPVQLADIEVLLGLLGLQNRAGIPIGPLEPLPSGTYVPGYREVKTHQLQMTTTKSFGPQLGASQVIVLGEIGYTYMNLPRDLLFGGPGNNLPAPAIGAFPASDTALTAGATMPSGEGFATRSSWGYRLLASASYANAFGGVTMSPRIVLSHDVRGVSPSFNEDTKAVNLGLGFNYQQNWVADISYTSFFGGRIYRGTQTARPDFAIGANAASDRDFVAASLSYAF